MVVGEKWVGGREIKRNQGDGVERYKKDN